MIDCSHLTEKEMIDRLSQLRFLRIEIRNLERKLRRLEQGVEHRKKLIGKLMDDGESWEDITRFVEPIFETYQSTKRCVYEYLEEYHSLTQFIHDIPDSRMRLILTERYLNGLTWLDVAFSIGEYDEQYPRRLHNQFIAEYVRRHQ